MSLERLLLIEAQALLMRAKRGELKDSTFGDVEVWWRDSTSTIIAGGYFKSGSGSVSFSRVETDKEYEGYDATVFEGKQASYLRYEGQLCELQSNNSGVALIRDSENEPWRHHPDSL